MLELAARAKSAMGLPRGGRGCVSGRMLGWRVGRTTMAPRTRTRRTGFEAMRAGQPVEVQGHEVNRWRTGGTVAHPVPRRVMVDVNGRMSRGGHR